MCHSSNSYYGEHPDKPSHIPIADLAHPRMFLRKQLPSFLLFCIVVNS